MEHIKVVWKDSKHGHSLGAPFKYRGVDVTKYRDGWTIGIEGDDNIYKSRFCSMNAIDQALGGTGKKGASNERKDHKIVILGKVTDYDRAGA